MVIKVDIDRPKLAPSLKQTVSRLRVAGYRVHALAESRSPSGRGIHRRIVVAPEPESMMELVALQAICGSDPVREAFNVVRARNIAGVPQFWKDRANVLYTESD